MRKLLLCTLFLAIGCNENKHVVDNELEPFTGEILLTYAGGEGIYFEGSMSVDLSDGSVLGSAAYEDDPSCEGSSTMDETALSELQSLLSNLEFETVSSGSVSTDPTTHTLEMISEGSHDRYDVGECVYQAAYPCDYISAGKTELLEFLYEQFPVEDRSECPEFVLSTMFNLPQTQ